MQTSRLEAFSDGVIAIIITIMVLELHVPKGSDWNALAPLIPILASYVLSFVYIAIYWNNHHHLLHTVENVDGAMMWANMHLLFWLSLIPFATEWWGTHPFDPIPTAAYGVPLFMSAIAYYILQATLLERTGKRGVLARALGETDFKGVASPILYATAIGVSFWWPIVAVAIYIGVAGMWLVPDKRIEQELAE